MTEAECDILNNARILLNKHQELENQESPLLEEDLDKLYNEYWHLIHDNIDKDIIIKVEERIGFDKFATVSFLDTLDEMLKDQDRIIDKYQGYTLMYTKDCWGDMSYFVFYNGRQQSESLSFVFDETAKVYFRRAIDENPGDPDFCD